jgi:hypothetical protein
MATDFRSHYWNGLYLPAFEPPVHQAVPAFNALDLLQVHSDEVSDQTTNSDLHRNRGV